MVSLQDFAKVGETSLFMGESSIDFIEQQMMERGYLDSREMSAMFNLLRSNDLIWANVVNNYLMGNKPPAFDLLYWNSDGTRMARAAHSWYLRNTYVENNLIEPGQGRAHGRADRPRPDQAGHLRRGRGEGPHRALVRGVADHPADRRQGALRAGLQRPHRRRHQPPGPDEGRLLGQRGAGRLARGVAGGGASATRAAGGRTGSPGSASARARRSSRRRSAAGSTRRWRTRRAPTCWRSRQSSLRSCAVAQEGEVDNSGFRPGLRLRLAAHASARCPPNRLPRDRVWTRALPRTGHAHVRGRRPGGRACRPAAALCRWAGRLPSP